MKNRGMIALTLILVLLIFYGCEKSPTGTEITEDEQAIQEFIIDDLDGYFTYDKHYGEADTVTVKTTKDDSRYTIWWRMPTDVERDITIHIENDSAFVTFSAEITGIFNLLVADTMPPDTIINYPKDLNDYLMRYSIFKRYPDYERYRGWRLEKISGAEITSEYNNVQIDSIRIQCISYPDTILKDPHMLFARNNILTFGPGEAVTLTLYSTDDIYAFLHARGRRGGLSRWRRWIFNEVSDGVWQGTWNTPLAHAIRPAVFDILHKNTLDDNQYPYDSNVWIFPYLVN